VWNKASKNSKLIGYEESKWFETRLVEAQGMVRKAAKSTNPDFYNCLVMGWIESIVSMVLEGVAKIPP
jgi:hypothetical protein